MPNLPSHLHLAWYGGLATVTALRSEPRAAKVRTARQASCWPSCFASPERNLVFDVNDFDETLPDPVEWDVKRLAASLAMAGRDNGFGAKARRRIVLAAARSYRTAMRQFAKQP
jgi:Uncharacterized protein conserved in bacteria (DUF2252)